MLGRQVLFVDAVARFVQGAEERLAEVPWVVARADTAIAGADAGAEWVRGHADPAGGEAEADGPRGRFAEDLLAIDRIFALQNLALGPARRIREGCHQRGQLGPQTGEDGGDLG